MPTRSANAAAISGTSKGTKICVLTSVHRADNHRLRKESRSAVASGLQVVLVAPHERSEMIDNYSVRALARPKSRRERMTSTVWSVYKAALDEDAAIYHFHDPELIPVGLLLKMRGRRVIYDAHEDVPRDIMIKEYIPLPLRWPLSKLAELGEKGAAQLFDGVIVAADHMLAGFKKARRVISVRNFPDLARFREVATQPPREDLTLIYIGTLSEERGLTKLVDALGRLPDRLPVQLVLHGEFESPDYLNALQAMPGWRRVRYGGPLDHNNVPAAMARADVGIALLQPTPTYIEAMPTKVYEYLAAGLTVLGANFPIYRDLLERHDCGICVDPTDPSAIAAAVERLASNPQERRERGKRGLRISEDYDWQGEAAKLVGLYDSVLQGSR